MGPCCECMRIRLTLWRDCEKSNRPRGGKPSVDSESAADYRLPRGTLHCSPPLAAYPSWPARRRYSWPASAWSATGPRLRPDFAGQAHLIGQTGDGESGACKEMCRTARVLTRAARCRGRPCAACGTVCLPIIAYLRAALCCLSTCGPCLRKRHVLPSWGSRTLPKMSS